MEDIIIHPLTRIQIDSYIANPSQGLLISGTAGCGKKTVARHIVTHVLSNSRDGKPIDYENYPYIQVLRPDEKNVITIESVRQIQQFLALKIPGATAGKIARAIVIENAHLLTIQAQNALLKTLEEPPMDTILLLTATSGEALLPPVQSRLQQLAVLPPDSKQLSSYFENTGYSKSDIDKALMLSGNLPGLSHALLSSDTSHPLYVAATHARGILQSKTYERLLLVDSLSKQKQLSLDIFFVLGQMSRVALLRSAGGPGEQRWKAIMKAANLAQEQLLHNTQTKLVLTNLMLYL